MIYIWNIFWKCIYVFFIEFFYNKGFWYIFYFKSFWIDDSVIYFLIFFNDENIFSYLLIWLLVYWNYFGLEIKKVVLIRICIY